MIWLTWRQFRAQALAAVGGLAVVAVYLVVLGLAIRHSHDAWISGCEAGGDCSGALDRFQGRYETQLLLVGALLVLVPAVIGAFWGAPLVARELETGTYQLVWNQSVTRTRWLAVKLAVIALAALAVTGLFSLLLTWAARPYDQLAGTRFTPLAFDSRNLVPAGHAVFAFALGATVGLLVRRTVPAMAATLAVFAAVQIVVPFAVRPHLMAPERAPIAVDAASLPRAGAFAVEGGPPGSGPEIPPSSTLRVEDYAMPGALVLTSSSRLMTPDGRPVLAGPAVQACLEPAQGDLAASGACLAKQNLHFDVTYQPAGRYWAFQLIETGLFAVLALLLMGFCLRHIPRSLA